MPKYNIFEIIPDISPSKYPASWSPWFTIFGFGVKLNFSLWNNWGECEKGFRIIHSMTSSKIRERTSQQPTSSLTFSIVTINITRMHFLITGFHYWMWIIVVPVLKILSAIFQFFIRCPWLQFLSSLSPRRFRLDLWSWRNEKITRHNASKFSNFSIIRD